MLIFTKSHDVTLLIDCAGHSMVSSNQENALYSIFCTLTLLPNLNANITLFSEHSFHFGMIFQGLV